MTKLASNSSKRRRKRTIQLVIESICAAMCECGCNEDAGVYPRTDYRYGTFKGHDKKYISGHWARGRHEPRGDYKEVRYVVDEETGCWTWVLSRSTKGKYGITRDVANKGTIGAHIASYIDAKGKIPKGLEIDHLCRNTLCVNPDHLEAVTRKVNNRRKPSTKLSEEKVAEIKQRLTTERVTQAQLGREYGVSDRTIRHVASGTRWADVA